MLDFVILHHQFSKQSDRNDHWDLMLRDGDELLTWAIERNPTVETCSQGTRLPNHRLKYLNYEGPISDDRGVVRRVVSGQFHWLQKTDDDNWTVELVWDDETVMTCSLSEGTAFEFEINIA